MSMLKYFFETGKDPKLFEGLKIMREKALCEKYMGKFPVISISLKSVDGRNFESASVALRTLIGNEAGRFDFLRNSANLSNDEKEAYAQLTEVGSSQGGGLHDDRKDGRSKPADTLPSSLKSITARRLFC